MSVFDDVDEEILTCYHEMTLANLIYYGLKEGACSEQSARMTAMDAASKNASEYMYTVVSLTSIHVPVYMYLYTVVSLCSSPRPLGEMIDKLTLTYNRTRQAVITRELIEIISGAAAL